MILLYYISIFVNKPCFLHIWDRLKRNNKHKKQHIFLANLIFIWSCWNTQKHIIISIL